jgi:hypothetical protein
MKNIALKFTSDMNTFDKLFKIQMKTMHDIESILKDGEKSKIDRNGIETP